MTADYDLIQSMAWWSGRLSHHVRALLDHPEDPIARELAAESLVEFEQRMAEMKAGNSAA